MITLSRVLVALILAGALQATEESEDVPVKVILEDGRVMPGTYQPKTGRVTLTDPAKDLPSPDAPKTVGQRTVRLTAPGGRQFTDIQSVDDLGDVVRITHATGGARVPKQSLPPDFLSSWGIRTGTAVSPQDKLSRGTTIGQTPPTTSTTPKSQDPALLRQRLQDAQEKLAYWESRVTTQNDFIQKSEKQYGRRNPEAHSVLKGLRAEREKWAAEVRDLQEKLRGLD